MPKDVGMTKLDAFDGSFSNLEKFIILHCINLLFINFVDFDLYQFTIKIAVLIISNCRLEGGHSHLVN